MMQPDARPRLLFGIAVQGAPLSSQAPASALRFARSVKRAGHKIHRVFFYHDGVVIANRFATLGPSETWLREGWFELAEYDGVELSVCITSCRKRGLIEANASTPDAIATLHPNFVVAGLGQLAEISLSCDRVITFAA